MRRDWRGHSLDHVVDVVETRIDDGLAERLEPGHVERDVVVDDEDRPRAAASRIADVVDHAFHREAMEVASAHLDDRTEAAIERAPARRLDHVHVAAHHRIAGQHARGPIWRLQRSVLNGRDGSRRGLLKAVRVTKPESCHPIEGGPLVERPDELPERQLALSANDCIDAEGGMCPRFRCEARVIASDDDTYAWLDRLDERDDSTRRASLKGHHRQPDKLGLEIADQLFHGTAYRCLREDQVSDRDAVMRVEVACQ